MLRAIIDWSTRNRFLVGLAVIFIGAAGLWAIRTIPLDALPDLTDVQVIVQTDYPEQAPQIVEDQVTYPITTQMLKVPGAKTVRGFSFFGMSLVYVIFDDGTDLYWARSRVLEYLNGLRGRLPASASPVVGPDATGLGWVYQYVLTSDRHSLYELRALQDWYLRYLLTAVPGVSEVASVGGYEKQYQVEVDPVRLQAFNIPITRVMEAVQGANVETGARVLEVSGREYMIRALGYARGIPDLENAVVGTTAGGTPIRVRDVANVQLGPEIRRGAADWNGRGEAVGGIVVMRFGENALTTIERVKERLAEAQGGLPEGVRVVPVYDRSDLIHRAIETLKEKLTEESLVVAAVCVVFLLHLRSSLVAILTLPLGVMMSLIVMRWMGISADIMSLGGIAIAIGAMIDAAVVMIENMHKHLERAGGSEHVKGERRWEIVREAAGEVGPALFFSLLVITVSFLPVFTLEAQEGRLFKPLAYTKTFAMASSALLAITVVPVAMGYLIRGRIKPEQSNPVNRWLMWLYRPALLVVLRHPWKTVGGCAVVLAATVWPASRLGSEFMPPLDEGTLLFMPTTVPGASITAARQASQYQDSILATFPEVASVFGKVGRANTATDPAQLDMIETVVVLKPHHQWRRGMTRERLVAELDSAARTTGYTNAWTQPIRGRIDMLATGIRTPVGIKIFGPDLRELERIGKEIEAAVVMVPGTRSVFAERAVSGSYLDIEVNREQAARYGLNVADVQRTIISAIGGMQATTTVEGRERFSVNVRYARDLRDSPNALRRVLIPVALGSASGGAGAAAPDAGGGPMPPTGDAGMGGGGRTVQVPLEQLATVRLVNAPMLVKTEDAFLTSWVQVDMAGSDIGSYVRDAKAAVERSVVLPPGYTLRWSGQYEFMERAVAKLKIVVPLTLLIIVVLLYMNFKNMRDLAIVLLSLPFSLVGGIWFIWALGYNLSVAVAVGFIALFGVAAETGVVMLIYLDIAYEHFRHQAPMTPSRLHEAIVEGAADRLRPKMMTVLAIMAGLLPIMWGSGAGGTVMRRIAAPMIGGMVSSTVLTLVVIPAIYLMWRKAELRRMPAAVPATPAE
ncbi:MAG: CusA/CzcA family heavy metal efflux RND transporter [Gemmatimonadales bacterium]|nr:CusA/CzcA family heavy metal efflux RND transporter [Gemmatimonadales bacterium]